MPKFSKDQLEYMINCVAEQVSYLREELDKMGSFDHPVHWDSEQVEAGRLYHNQSVEEFVNDLLGFEDCLKKLEKLKEDL